MKILITGCAGFIGFSIAKFLLQKNFQVIGVDNINNYYSKNLKFSRLNSVIQLFVSELYVYSFVL